MVKVKIASQFLIGKQKAQMTKINLCNDFVTEGKKFLTEFLVCTFLIS